MPSQAPPRIDKLDTELLVSVAVVVSGDIETDASCIRRCHETMFAFAKFYEVVAVSAQATPEWFAAMEGVIADCENVRLVVLEDAYDFELFALAALNESIGDFVAVLYAGEVDAGWIPVLVDRARTGFDLVKLRDPERSGRWWSRTATWALRVLTGYRAEPGILRTLCLSRRVISAIAARRGDEHYFRFLDTDSGYRQGFIETAPLTRRHSWRDFMRRAMVVLDLIGHAAPRLLKVFALAAFVVAVINLAYGAYALVLWTFRNDVAEGWTSLSMVLALTFGFAFVLLAVMAVGVARTLEALRQGHRYAVAREIGRTDLFGRFTAINVERSE